MKIVDVKDPDLNRLPMAEGSGQEKQKDDAKADI
jgi:hypothetical protein